MRGHRIVYFSCLGCRQQHLVMGEPARVGCPCCLLGLPAAETILARADAAAAFDAEDGSVSHAPRSRAVGVS